MYIVFDTETSNGFVNHHASNNEQSIQLVQIAFKVFSNERRQIRASSCLVRQTIPICESSKMIHGITDEDCKNFGRPVETVFNEFNYWFNRAEYAVGFNLNFDMRVMEIVAHRLGSPFNKNKNVVDVMLLANSVMKLPLSEKQVKFGIKGYRNPKLSDAYQFFTGTNLVDAHDAMVDVDATIAVLDVINVWEQPSP